ncbi:hypothetical protein K466DRAFT_111609 [Polyporus arcularius HHB13444]|uniref:Uncharacterized protein n=1 Tax=Polyporus arcularius HHB13444 TaxID=1314778 RepID=A0A5C3PNA2_9APHY|nr:hypothetical protein K466DRAFT_111609 [Polyporus arcularius HHB13444]
MPPEPKAGPSNALPINAVEHADDAGEPRRRRVPSRANRSPSRDPPPRARDRSRYFSSPDDASVPSWSSAAPSNAGAKVTLRGPGTEAAMNEFARTIGLSPPRPANIEIPDSEEEDLYATAPVRNPATSTGGAKAGHAAKHDSKQTSKQKVPLFADSSSDEFGPDEFVINEEFLREINAAEQLAYQNGGGSSQSQSQTRVQAPKQTQVKAEVSSRAASATLAVAAASSTAVASRSTPGMGSRAASRATSVPGTSSSGSKSGTASVSMDVINISDDEDDIEKENVPIATRHVRRRVEPRANDDIIELSD